MIKMRFYGVDDVLLHSFGWWFQEVGGDGAGECPQESNADEHEDGCCYAADAGGR